MRQIALFAAILIPLALVAPVAQAEEDLIDYVLEACDADIKTYCSQVTPGEGRLLACFYAHGDKVSAGCELAVYSAAVVLEELMAAIGHLAAACEDDLMKHCSEVEIGEGRVAECLLDHIRAKEVLPWAHITFGNLKTWLRGTFHGVSAKHLQLYLDEFSYRFDRRWVENRLGAFILRRAARAEPLPYRRLVAEPVG